MEIMKKKVLILILILVLAAAAAAAWYFLIRPRAADAGEKIYVQSVEILQSYGGYSSRYSGKVETQKTESTEFDTERRLNELFVKVGDSVKEGDPLFSYDTESISLEIDQINLEIEKTKTEVSNNTTQIEQLSKDMEKLSDADRLDYSAQIAQLQADIAQSNYDIRTKESEIKQKQASINNSTVTAKMGGTVTVVNDADAIIKGTSIDETGSPSSVFIVVQADGNFRVKGRISETNIGSIFVGQRLTVRSRADENQTWEGTIAEIDTQNTDKESNDSIYMGSSSESASKYAFYVELDSTDGLMIGQHVTLEPSVSENPTASGIWLDSGWLVTGEDGGTYVWAAPSDGARLEKRPVVTGQVFEETDQIEITSGLELTDYIAWPDSSCREGAPTTSEYVVPEEETQETDNPELPPEELEGFGNIVDTGAGLDDADFDVPAEDVLEAEPDMEP